VTASLEGLQPYLWLDAKVEKVREGGRVVRKALVLAYGVSTSPATARWMLAALLRPLLGTETGERARELVGEALERLREPLPKVAALLEEAEEDLFAFYSFPTDHWRKLRSTNPLERVNREIVRRTDVVGIFPNDRSLVRLAASLVIEQKDEWLVGHSYLSNHSLEAVLEGEKEDKGRKETRELTAG